MAAPTKITPTSHRLAERLRPNIEGEVLFDAFSRGRYSTDASMYQIEPVGVVVPKTEDDVRAALEIAREEGVSAAAARGRHLAVGADGRPLAGDRLHQAPQQAGRGGCGCAHRHRAARHRARRVEPAAASRRGLWFPVDVSTASRATIGGMTGNNSCGTRSIRYGIMRDNVLAIDAILPDGSEAHFGEVGHNLSPSPLWGGVRGGGNPDVRVLQSPPPCPSPTRGEGTLAAPLRCSATCWRSGGARLSTSRHAFPEVSSARRRLSH